MLAIEVVVVVVVVGRSVKMIGRDDDMVAMDVES